jgi:hypothetical protein
MLAVSFENEIPFGQDWGQQFGIDLNNSGRMVFRLVRETGFGGFPSGSLTCENGAIFSRGGEFVGICPIRYEGESVNELLEFSGVGVSSTSVSGVTQIE